MWCDPHAVDAGGLSTRTTLLRTVVSCARGANSSPPAACVLRVSCTPTAASREAKCRRVVFNNKVVQVGRSWGGPWCSTSCSSCMPGTMAGNGASRQRYQQPRCAPQRLIDSNRQKPAGGSTQAVWHVRAT